MSAPASLIQTVIGLYVIAVILRFLFELLRVDFRNPLAQMIVAVTNPPLRVMRRFIPGLYGIDLSAVALIWILELVKLAAPLMLAGYPFGWSGALVLSLAEGLNSVVWVFLLAVLASVVVSWVAPRSAHPAVRIVDDLSRPVMMPFRRLLPPIGGLDFSPIATLFALRLAQQFLLSPLAEFGARLL